jgi:hypothetical protein
LCVADPTTSFSWPAVARCVARTHHRATLTTTAARTTNRPTTHPRARAREYLVEYNDTLATLLLSSVTQGLSSQSELTDKFGLAVERPGRRGGRGGGMLPPGMYGM